MFLLVVVVAILREGARMVECLPFELNPPVGWPVTAENIMHIYIYILEDCARSARASSSALRAGFSTWQSFKSTGIPNHLHQE